MKLLDKFLKVLKTDRNTFFTYILTLLSIYIIVDRLTEILLISFTGISVSYWNPIIYTLALACPIFAFLFCYASKFAKSKNLKVSFFYLYITALYIITVSMFVQWTNLAIWMGLLSLPGYAELATNFSELFKPALTAIAIYLPLTTFYPVIKWLYCSVNDSPKLIEAIQTYGGISLAKQISEFGQYTCQVVFGKNADTGKEAAIPEISRYSSLLISGPSGSGKSSLLLEPMIAYDIDKKYFFKEISKEMGFTALKTGLASLNCPYGNDYLNKNFNLNMLTPNQDKMSLFKTYMNKMILCQSGTTVSYKNLGLTVMAPDIEIINHMVGVAENYNLSYNIIDPSNPSSIGLNPFVYDDAKQTAVAISSLLKGMYKYANSDAEITFKENVCLQAVESVAMLLKEVYPRMHDDLLPTLEDLLKSLNDFDLVEEMCEVMKKDPELSKEYSIQIAYFEKNFYENGSGRTDLEKYITMATTQLDNLLRYPGVRTILCNRYNNINYDDALANGEITFVCTRRGDLGATAHKAFGLFFLLLMQFSVLRRPGNENTRVPHALYIDEFADFACSSTEVFFTTYRKYKVAVSITTQSIAQLGQESEKIKQLILANCINKITTGNNTPEENSWWSLELGEKKYWKYNDSYNTEKGEYDPKLGGISYALKENYKPGKVQVVPFKQCLYKIRVSGKNQYGNGKLNFLDSKYKEKHLSKSYNYDKFTSGMASDEDALSKRVSHRKTKFGTPHFNDNQEDEVDPIMMNTTDKKFFYENEDAAIFDLKKGNPNG